MRKLWKTRSFSNIQIQVVNITNMNTVIANISCSSFTDVKQKELLWKKLKSDPVRLHSWYKTFWDVHGLK